MFYLKGETKMAIKMTPSEIRDLAATISGIRDDIVTQVGTMNTRIEADTQDWDGASKEQYFAGYLDILPTLTETFPAVIQDLEEKLKFAANTLEQADQDIASALK